MVVEDDSTSRDVIYLFLKNLYEVSFAEDGEKALKSIDGKQFDLIIMDINLGSGINGIEVTDTIRKLMDIKQHLLSQPRRLQC